MTEGSGYGPYAYSDPSGGHGYGGGYGGYGGYPAPPPPPRRRGGVLSHVVVALVALAIGVGATLALYQPGSGTSTGNVALPGAGAVPSPGSSSPAASGGSGSEQSVVSKVEPGVVLINSSLQYDNEAGAGTGMVINSDGLVLTNNHVIESSTKLSATVVSTGKTYTATVVGYDKTGDVALIKLEDASNLKTVPLGNSSSIKSGDSVVALGNAEGQGSLVPAAGSITGTNKTITASDDSGTDSSETLKGMLETNADIVSGDSGGPLSDTSGQVIGMDTAGDSVSMGEQAPANGFAIPINTALSVAKQIAAGQASSTVSIGYPPFIGIYIASGTSSNPQQQAEEQEQNGGESGGFGGQQQTPSCYENQSDLEVPAQIASVSSGTLVIGVICDSPAASSGMTAGSVITSVNGQAAGSPSNLSTILAKLKAGDTAQIGWVSPAGQQETSSMHLVAGPPQ